MTNRTPTHTPRWLRAALRCGAVCLLAGGLIYCTDQSDLTSVDPALVPADDEAILHLDAQGDDPADAPLRPQQMKRTLGDRIETLAVEHALSVELTEALRDAVEAVLSGGTPADLFLAVTQDDGAGDFKTVVLDIARLRSALSEGPISEEALEAELARHLRVGQSPNTSSLEGRHFECSGAEGAVLDSSYESQIASMTMTCETVKTSTGGFSMRGVIERN